MKRQTWYDVKGSDTDDWNEASRPAIVELQYTYDNSHNVRRREDIRGNHSVGLATRDEVYEYDGLDRLATAQRGNRNHSTDAFTVAGDKGQDWSLDALGNWLSLKTDIDGDGDFNGSDREDARTFTLANEVIDQTLTNPNYPDELGFEFDDAGNQTGREVNPDQTGADGKWIYIYDAWNRLVEVRIDSDGDGNYDEVRARYGYNGLHQRTTRRANSNDLVIDGDDPGHLYYYDASWRLLEERIDAAWDGANNTFASDEIVQRIWCPLYIDALIAMQTDVDDDVDSGDPDGDFTDADADIYYAVLDRKYDVIAMMSAGGTVAERVRYTPYGVAQNHPNTDLNGDGAVNGADLADYLASGGSRADTDFNRDGSVDGADLATLLSSYTVAEPEGVISRIGNTVGYSGYVYDDAINMSLARFRWYDAEMGRWMTRDPVLYLTSSNLYGYVASQPLKFLDPSGLSEEDPDENCDNSNNDDCSDNNLKKLCRLLAARERNNCDNQRLLNKINQMTLVGGATAVGSASTGVAGAKARRAGYSRVARASRTRSDLTNRLGNAAQRSLSQGQAHKAGSILNKTGKAAEAVGKSLGVVGVVVDGASAIHSVKEGDLSGAGISAASGILGVITFIYPPTAVVGVMSGVGLIVIDAAVVGPARSAHNKANTKLCDALDDALLDHAKKNPGCSERIGECK